MWCLSARDPSLSLPQDQNLTKKKPQRVAIDEKDVVHPPGVEPGPIAWKAIILPLDQECLMKDIAKYLVYSDSDLIKWTSAAVITPSYPTLHYE
jgi:hypothetical protein